MHQFPKVNRTQVVPRRKYYVNCVGGVLDWRCVHVQRVVGMCNHVDRVGVQKIFKPGKILTLRETSRQRRRPAEEPLDVMPL